MTREPVALATSIVRNSVALMAVGLLAKGMGLVNAVLVARFLGPDALGLFALLASIALLVEFTAPLGLQDLLIREVASHPGERIRLWKQSIALVFPASLLPATGFLIAAYFFRDQETVRNCLLTLAVGTPCAAMALLGQAVLQGMEKVLYLTWSTFLTRVASLAVLVVLLMRGADVEAAFIARVLFQASSAVLFAARILRDPPTVATTSRPAIGLARAAPFAVNRVLTETTTRAPVLLLPVLFTLAEIGIFDAADRIRLTLSVMVAVATTAIMPVFARSFAGPGDGRHTLVAFSVKYACLIPACAALAISAFAHLLVGILYGEQFTDSAMLLQVLVWTQVLVATDMVLKQAMIARGREYAVVLRALVGLVCLGILVLGLGRIFGLLGAAAGVIAASAITLTLDARFVAREVQPFDVPRFLLKPLASVLPAGAVLLLLDSAPLPLRIGAGLATLLIAAAATKLLPRAERDFLWEALRHGLGRR